MKDLLEVLEKRDYAALLGKDLKKVASRLIQFLYYEEPLNYIASEALGFVCKSLEEEGEIEFVKEIIRRLLWTLRDESGSYCKGAPLALGEICRNCPRSFEGFENILLSLIENFEVERKYVEHAIRRCERLKTLMSKDVADDEYYAN